MLFLRLTRVIVLLKMFHQHTTHQKGERVKPMNRSKTIAQKINLNRAYYLFAVVFLIAASSSFSQVTYSATGWAERLGSGPWGDKLHSASTANATATIRDTGTEAFVVYRSGPQCGIFQAVVDGKTETMVEVDAYSPVELWNKKSVVASDLVKGPHTVVVTVTGKKNAKSSNTTISIVDKWTLGRGMWSAEKAWAWYKSKPWIVGWNYTPTTCVNSTEWWQDEKHVSDSSIHRELKIGEQLGFNSIIIYMQYLVWEKDSAYYKDRFKRFLDIAESHHFTVSPTFFDDVNFVCSGDDCGNSHLGDQGEPDPAKLMSQWGGSPGPSYVLNQNNYPKFKRYVQDFIRTFGQDKRILMWNLYNEPSNSGIGTRTFPLCELAFQWVREVGASQPLTISEWTGQGNGWPYNLSDICSFHGYINNGALSGAIDKLSSSQRPVLCTEWLARQAGTDIAKDLPLFKRLGVGNFCWSIINGRMHCERSWPSFSNSNNPWFHDVLYNDGKPYRAEEVDAIFKNLAHKTINWLPGTADGSLVVKKGCTDPRYAEFDSMATSDDGSGKTLLPRGIPGCMDPKSKNFCPFATESDPAMCNAVAVTQPSEARLTKMSSQKSFSFIGKNQIRILGQGLTRVELFSINGALAWDNTVEGPCVIALDRALKYGIYCARISGKDGNAVVTPLFRVVD